MIAGIVLVLVMILPDRTLQTKAVPMPSMHLCEAAASAFIRLEPDAHVIPQEQSSFIRSAACLTVPTPGRDA